MPEGKEIAATSMQTDNIDGKNSQHVSYIYLLCIIMLDYIIFRLYYVMLYWFLYCIILFCMTMLYSSLFNTILSYSTLSYSIILCYIAVFKKRVHVHQIYDKLFDTSSCFWRGWSHAFAGAASGKMLWNARSPGFLAFNLSAWNSASY